MEPASVQNSFLLKKIKSIYVGFVILVFILVGALLIYYKLNAGPTEEETTAPPTGTEKALVKVGIPVEVTGIFPATAPEAFNMAFNANIFEGLTVFRQGKIVPGLATSWSSPDKNTWRFKLRSGVIFQNGNKLVAEDVKYSIEQAQASMALSQEKQWPTVPLVSNIASVTVVDQKTVEIKTTEPDPVLLSKLAWIFILSKGQAEKEGFDKLVGTGPYKLKAFEQGTYTLEANQNYWGGKPKVKEAVYKYVLPNEAAKALSDGSLDLTVLISSADNKGLEQKGFSIKSFDLPVVFQLTFDVARDKTPYVDASTNPFKDKRVRQAFLYGINIDEFIKNAVPDGKPASQLVTSGIFGYDQTIKRPAYDLEKAKKLLAEAGFQNGFNLTVDVGITYQTDQEIVRQLERLGIKAKANVLQEDQFSTKIGSGDFSLIANAWAADSLDIGDLLDGVMHTKTQTKGQGNAGGYSNPEVDKLIDDASKTFDPKKRLGLLQNATKAALEDVAIMPLYSTKNFSAVSSDFSWAPHNFGLIYAYEIVGR
jgi:peptide/nickel transport system substrate-binding protein